MHLFNEESSAKNPLIIIVPRIILIISELALFSICFSIFTDKLALPIFACPLLLKLQCNWKFLKIFRLLEFLFMVFLVLNRLFIPRIDEWLRLKILLSLTANPCLKCLIAPSWISKHYIPDYFPILNLHNKISKTKCKLPLHLDTRNW